MAWTGDNVAIDTNYYQDVVITGSLTVDSKIKLNDNILTTATNIPLILKTDSLIIKPYGDSTPDDGILDIQKHDGSSVFKVNPNTGVVDINGSFNAGSIGISSLDLDNIDIDGNIIKIDSTGRSDGSIDNRVQIEQLLVKIGSNQADLFSVQDSSGGNVINVDTTASPNLVLIDASIRLGGSGAYIATNETTDIDFQANDKTTVMRFETDNKRLGINTTTPAAALHAVGANAGYFSNSAAQDCLVTIQGGSSNDAVLTFKADKGLASANITKVYQEDGVGFHIKTNNSLVDSMTILSAGNVGIGNTAPESKLEVNGDIRIPNGNRLYFYEGYDYNYLDFSSGTLNVGYTADALRFDLNESTTKTMEMVANSNFEIKGYNDKDIFITPQGTGKVGIGTTSPGAALHLASSGLMTLLQSSSTLNSMQFQDSNTGLSSNANNGTTIGTNTGVFHINNREDKNIQFATNDTTRMIIKNNGMVGIGLSPSVNLHVLRNGYKEVARFESTSVTGSRITIESDSNLSSTVAERDGHLVLQDTNSRKVAIGFDQPDSLLHMSGADPYMTFTNTALEDSAEGRESKLIFEGTTVAGGSAYDSAQHHLAEINVSHYKNENDKKGQFTFKVNDGNDDNGSLQTAVNIDSYKNVVIGGRTSFNGTTGSCAALYAEYTGSAMGTTSHSAAIKAVIDHDNSSDTFPPNGSARPGLLIVNKDSTTNSFSTLQFSNTDDRANRPVASISARAIHGAQSQGLLSIGVGGASGASHNSQILALKKNGSDTWFSITNVKDTNGNNDASDADDARKSILKFVGVTQDGGVTYDAIEHDLANIVVSHHGTANDKKGKFKILVNDGDDVNSSLTQAMFIGSDEGHTALGLGAGANLGDSHHNQYNTFIGKNAGVGTNTGDGNVAVGAGALYYNQKANFNTALGYEAAKFIQHSNDNGTSTSNADVDMYNTCIGFSAMPTSKQGIENTIIGANAGYQLKADGNVAIGRSALSTEDYGDSTVAIGNYALNHQNDVTSSSGSNSTTGNVAVGHHAGKFLEEGLDCTFIGSQAGMGLNTDRLDGHDNTAVGSKAGYSLITTAAGNTLIGTKAGYLQTTANNNVVIGYNASYYNLTGGASVFVGNQSGIHTRSTTGTNTVMGYKAMYNGHSTYNDNIAHSNTVIGSYAMGENTDAALTAVRNCILGAYAGKEMLSSDDCILIGYSAGVALTTGNDNTLVGNYSGENITTGASNTMLGYHNNASAVDVTHEIVIGAGADHNNPLVGQGTETCTIGTNTDYITVDFGENATWSHSSDRRIKKNIEDNKLGLEFINRLRTVTYNKKAPSEYPSYFNAHDANKTERKNPDKKHFGFIAQEVKKAIKAVGEKDFPMWNEQEDGMQTLSEASLIPPLVKAIQELSKEIEELKRRLNE